MKLLLILEDTAHHDNFNNIYKIPSCFYIVYIFVRNIYF